MGKAIDEKRAISIRAKSKGPARGKVKQEATTGATFVLLEDEIAKAFPTSAAVNEALLALLALTETVTRLTAPAKRTRAPRKAAKGALAVPR